MCFELAVLENTTRAQYSCRMMVELNKTFLYLCYSLTSIFIYVACVAVCHQYRADRIHFVVKIQNTTSQRPGNRPIYKEYIKDAEL